LPLDLRLPILSVVLGFNGESAGLVVHSHCKFQQNRTIRSWVIVI